MGGGAFVQPFFPDPFGPVEDGGHPFVRWPVAGQGVAPGRDPEGLAVGIPLPLLGLEIARELLTVGKGGQDATGPVQQAHPHEGVEHETGIPEPEAAVGVRARYHVFGRQQDQGPDRRIVEKPDFLVGNFQGGRLRQTGGPAFFRGRRFGEFGPDVVHEGDPDLHPFPSVPGNGIEGCGGGHAHFAIDAPGLVRRSQPDFVRHVAGGIVGEKKGVGRLAQMDVGLPVHMEGGRVMGEIDPLHELDPLGVIGPQRHHEPVPFRGRRVNVDDQLVAPVSGDDPGVCRQLEIAPGAPGPDGQSIPHVEGLFRLAEPGGDQIIVVVGQNP